MTALGQFIRQHRIRHDLTQADLARRAGIDSTYVNAIETGRKRPSGAQLLQAVGDALQLDSEERQALHKAAELSQRSLRLPEELPSTKSELVRVLVEDLPYLNAPDVDILMNVLAALRLRHTPSLASTQPCPQGRGAM